MTSLNLPESSTDPTSETTESHSDHPSFLAHHWNNPLQQFEAGKLGMWLFLATEVLLFGGLFVAYSIIRGRHPEIFHYGSQFLDRTMGATNTIILICSSLTMAIAVTAAQQNRRRLLIGCLSLTILGGMGFMGIKYAEYTHKFHEGLFWGLPFYEESDHGGHQVVVGDQAGHDEAIPLEAASSVGSLGHPLDPIGASTIPPASVGPMGLNNLEATDLTADEDHAEVIHTRDPNRPKNAHLFFTIYYLMTGLHGIHVLLGMGAISWVLIGSIRGRFSSAYFTPVDLTGLYWHIVDLIWIFLFPMFYLIG